MTKQEMEFRCQLIPRLILSYKKVSDIFHEITLVEPTRLVAMLSSLPSLDFLLKSLYRVTVEH